MVVTLIVISFAFFSYGFELQLGGAQGAGSAKTGTGFTINRKFPAQNPFFVIAHFLLRCRPVAHVIHIGFASTVQDDFTHE